MTRKSIQKFALPVNQVGTALGIPFPLIPTGPSLYFYSKPLGEGSDRVPPIATTRDAVGPAHKDLRDPTGQWRNPDQTPVSPERQIEITRNWNRALDEIRREIMEKTTPSPLPLPTVDQQCKRDFERGLNWTWPRDPLVLDLDNDGIELISSNSTVLFDHNADGVKTGTQWVRADDGMLVRDINGNGVIDSGRELFGDQTKVPNGQLAANGFAALSALDSNSDGVMDANDAAFVELRVWRDLNQDGISQTNELQSLDQAGITNINLTANAQGVSTFTKTTTDAEGNPISATLAVRNVNFTSDNFYREFTDNPVSTETAATLPQMRGAGLVRDLREAMSLGTTRSSALEQILGTFKAATTAQQRQGQIDTILNAWANTSAMGDAISRNPVPANASNWHASSPGQAIADFARKQPALYQQLSILERFNGQSVIERYIRQINSYYYDAAQARYVGYTYYIVSIEGPRLPFFQSAYDALKASTYQSLYLQTVGKDLLDQVELIIDDKGLRLDFTAVNEAFAQKSVADPGQATVELAEFIHFTQDSLSQSGWDGAAQLANLLETASFNSEQTTAMQYLQLKQATDAGGTLYGANDADILVGKAGNDTLAGNAGADILIGGAGNDTLVGGQGNDQLVGGQGNDSLDGQWGNDTYFWGRGQGNDNINDTFADANGQNTVVLRGIHPQDIQVSLLAPDDYRAVRITIADTGETLLLRNASYYSRYEFSGAPVNLVFADGTQWDMRELIRQTLPMPTDGNDTLVGSWLDDLPSRLRGGAGDDLSCVYVRNARSREKLRVKVGSSPRGISAGSYRKCSEWGDPLRFVSNFGLKAISCFKQTLVVQKSGVSSSYGYQGSKKA